MARLTRLLLVVLSLWLAVLASPARVAAHAYLERAEPTPEAVLAMAPTSLRLWFTETMEPRYSEIVVLDTAGQPVHTTRAELSADALSMTLALPPLPDGVYTVTWKNVSTVDGHPARGYHSLTVGSPSTTPVAPPVLPVPVETVPIALSASVRWLTFAGQALLVGALLALLVVFRPALRSVGLADSSPAGQVVRRRSRIVLIASLAILAAAAIMWLLVQTATVTSTSLLAAIGSPIIDFLSTRNGLVWLARVALLIGLAVLILIVGRRERPWRWLPWLTVALGVALLLTTSLTSHAAAQRDPLTALVAVAADWLHLVATSLWLGGLALLVAAAPPMLAATAADLRPRLLSQLVNRFSAVALASVTVLVLTGTVGAVLHLGRLDALWTTEYGRALLLKLLVLLPMLALGAINLIGVRPVLARAAAMTRPLSQRGRALTAAAARAWRTLRRTVPVELVLGVVILAASGILTSLPPTPPAGPAAGLRLVEEAGGLRLALGISPAQPGANTYELVVTEGGRPVDDASRVLLRFSLLDQDVGESEAVLAPAGQGRYVGQGRQMAVTGEWQTEIIVRRDGRDDARTAVRFPIPASAPAAGSGSGSLLPALPVLTPGGTVALVMLALAGIAVVVALRLRRSGSFAGVLFGASGGAVALATYLLVTQGLLAVPSATAGPRNPIAPTAQSLAQGRVLYTANCVSCHGVGGRGDGLAAAGLNPPPLDLTQHVGYHSEGELYRMISQGIRGTAMPPFAGRLTEEERWHLVNYIRTFDARAGN